MTQPSAFGEPPQSLRSGFGWLLFAELSVRGLSFATAVFVARLVGPREIGDYLVALAILSYGSVLADAGLTVYAQREVVQRPEKEQAGVVVTATLILQLAFCMAAALLVATAVSLLPVGEHARNLALIGLPSLAAQALSLIYLLQAYEAMKLAAGLRVAAQLVSTAGGLVAVAVTEEILWLIVFSAVGTFAVDVVCLSLAHRRRLVARGVSLASLRVTLRGGMPFLLNALLVAALFNSDILFVGMIRGSGAAGIYGSAYRPVVAILTMFTVVVTAVFPRLVKLALGDPEGFASLLRDIVVLGLRIAYFSAGLVLVFAGPIIEALYGARFSQAGPVLRVLFLWVPFGWVSTMAGQALLAAGHYRAQILVASGSVVTSVALLGALVPDHGAVGAAVAVAIAELATAVGFAFILHRRLHVWLGSALAVEFPYLLLTASALMIARAITPQYWLLLGSVAIIVGLGALERYRARSTWALFRSRA